MFPSIDLCLLTRCFLFCLFFSREAEEVNEGDKKLNAEKPMGEENATEGYKETPVDEVEEKELEDKVEPEDLT